MTRYAVGIDLGTTHCAMARVDLQADDAQTEVLEVTQLLSAAGELVYLVSPGLRAPDPASAAAMILAGVAWGVYSLRGRGTARPLAVTAGNFLFAVAPAWIWFMVAGETRSATARGILLALASGALTSGLGYVIWYAALRGLSATRAATVQLSVPVIAAIGGILFLSEVMTLRLAMAAVLILGGVGIALAARRR